MSIINQEDVLSIEGVDIRLWLFLVQESWHGPLTYIMLELFKLCYQVITVKQFV